MMKTMITGAAGRMGTMLIRAVHADEGAVLTAAIERAGSSCIGENIGAISGVGCDSPVLLQDSLDAHAEVDVLIDFSAPEATLAHATFASEHGIPMVIGTTGFSADQLVELKLRLKDTSVVMAANYSVGVNLALTLIEQAARVLRAESYDAELFEAHHRHKVDAPSGTALAMGHALASGRDVSLDDVAVYSREGITGARDEGSIGFSVMRAGNIVGDHKAMFVSDEERIEINHFATDRIVFAKGAVRAAKWLMGRPSGWYDMQDVLGIKEG